MFSSSKKLLLNVSQLINYLLLKGASFSLYLNCEQLKLTAPLSLIDSDGRVSQVTGANLGEQPLSLVGLLQASVQQRTRYPCVLSCGLLTSWVLGSRGNSRMETALRQSLTKTNDKHSIKQRNGDGTVPIADKNTLQTHHQLITCWTCKNQ